MKINLTRLLSLMTFTEPKKKTTDASYLPISYETTSQERCYSFELKETSDKQAYNQFEPLIQNQPEITMKNLKGWANNIQENIKDYRDWGYLVDGIEDMLEEIGVKIKK